MKRTLSIARTAIIAFLVATAFSVRVTYAAPFEKLIEDAVLHNPEFRQEIKAYRAIQSELREAQSGYYPTVDLNAGIGYEEVDRSDVGGIDNSGGDGLTRKEGSINLTQNLFQGFATQDNVARVKHKRNAQAYQALATANNLAMQMIQAYIDLLKEDELLKLAQNNLDTHLKIFDQIKKRTDAGIGNQVELNQAKARVALAKSSLSAAKNNYDDVKASFRRILGRDPDSLLMKPEFSIQLPKDIQTATHIALLEHPQIKSADEDVFEAKMQYKGSRSQFYPRFDIEISRSMDENINGIQGREENMQAMLRMRYNLYNGGRDSAVRRRTASQYHQAAEIRNNTRRQVIEDLRYAWNANTYISEQLEHISQHINMTHETLIGYRKQFSLGRRSLLDLLNTENEYYGALETLINNEADRLKAQYKIVSGMGLLLNQLNIEFRFLDVPTPVTHHLDQRTTDQTPVRPLNILAEKTTSPTVADAGEKAKTNQLNDAPEEKGQPETLSENEPNPIKTEKSDDSAQKEINHIPLYTIQLASFVKEQDAKAFIERFKLEQAHYELRQVRGKQYFAVSAGQFAGYSKAKQAVPEYQTKIGRSVWIRKLEDMDQGRLNPVKTSKKTTSKEPAPRSNQQQNEKQTSESSTAPYTVQLASFVKEQDAKNFIERFQLDRATYAQRFINGKRYFSVRAGAYQSQRKARKAASEFEALTGKSAWVLKLSE
ncbi:TolC family outer membrane protein [Thiomicrospira sp. WB1]|uniref:TolC family outer membrane protein n=1 Tax=Thiomicrospira sp. WB1 TaxID=1685380 RepID=UPI0009EA624D|nr:TolC family outer membrane protein [Thiomicrospira sp. WB1]